MAMRLMGIDYGSKRVGVALSDESGAMAFPHVVLENSPSLVADLSDIALKESVAEIVVGHSKDRDGSDNQIHEAAKELITSLTMELNLPIHLEPEYYSTQEAIRFQGRTEKTDAAAASVILNSYITRAKK